MLRSTLDKLAVLGRSGALLASVSGILLFALLVPFTLRQLYWLTESERIVEETADPVILDFLADPNVNPPVPRDTWSAGQTFYVERTLCVYKQVTGVVERTIVDTARIPINPIQLSTLLYLDASAYDATGRLLRPPWCGKRLSEVTVPTLFAGASGPAALHARIDAHLNPLKPHVFITLRPARFILSHVPAPRVDDAEAKASREALDVRTLLITRRLDLLMERFRDAERHLEQVQAYQRQLDKHLRAQRVLPPAPGTGER